MVETYLFLLDPLTQGAIGLKSLQWDGTYHMLLTNVRARLYFDVERREAMYCGHTDRAT